MPCLECGTSALRCFLTSIEAARTAGLRVRNVRYLTCETSGHLCRMDSSALRNRPAHTSRSSILQRSRALGIQPTPFPVEDPRPKNEPCHRDGNGSLKGVEDPMRKHANFGEAIQRATIPVPLHLRQDSKFKGLLESQLSPKNGAPSGQDLLGEKIKGPEQRGDAISSWPKDARREKNPRSSKVAGISRRARLRDYAFSTDDGSQGATRSSPSTKASADFPCGTRNYRSEREPWQTQKSALSEKFGSTGWSPRKRLSPDTLDGIRALHAQYPDKFTTPILADQFKVSPEAIRRILKSKWRPKDVEEERRRQRWEKRGENIWSQMVEMGIKPPRKWRDMGVGKSRERMPARSEQLESQFKGRSKVTSSLQGQSTTDFHIISAKRHETDSPVPLADRIL